MKKYNLSGNKNRKSYYKSKLFCYASCKKLLPFYCFQIKLPIKGGNSVPQRMLCFVALTMMHSYYYAFNCSTMTSVFSGVDDEIYVLIFGLFSDVTQQTMDVFFLCTLQFSVSFQGFHFKISSGGLEKGARECISL